GRINCTRSVEPYTRYFSLHPTRDPWSDQSTELATVRDTSATRRSGHGREEAARVGSRLGQPLLPAGGARLTVARPSRAPPVAPTRVSPLPPRASRPLAAPL